MSLRDYYTRVRPFFAAEMALRTDIPEWVAFARTARARSVLDLGCGSGRVGAALAADDPRRSVVGLDLLDVLIGRPPAIPFVRGDMRALPFARRFDLVVAANDPFAHLLDDRDRETALAEAQRVGALVAIDALFVDAAGDFEKVRRLPDGTRLTEEWRALGGDVFETRYRYVRDGHHVDATTSVRSWRVDEPALRSRGAELRGTMIVLRGTA